jgi:hypothetical protein
MAPVSCAVNRPPAVAINDHFRPECANDEGCCAYIDERLDIGVANATDERRFEDQADTGSQEFMSNGEKHAIRGTTKTLRFGERSGSNTLEKGLLHQIFGEDWQLQL